MAGRILSLLFGGAAYVVGMATVLYIIGFVGNLLVPKSIDSGQAGPVGEAVLVDLLLLAAFGLQHSGMSRPAFKRWWTRLVPRHLERNLYVLVSSLVLIFGFWAWRPLPAEVWRVDNAAGALARISHRCEVLT